MANADRVSSSWISEQIDELSAEERARLIKKLLLGSGLSVVLLTGSVIEQVNLMGKEELSELMHAIAERLAGFGT